MNRLISFALLLSLGCQPDLGEADPAAAEEVVYDQNGVPAFAGQALMIQSCGAGGYCHSRDIPLVSRYGAPAELTFDLRLASTTVDGDDAAMQRLSEDQRRVRDLAGAIWEQVTSGRMPPAGRVGDEYAAAVAGLRFDRVANDGTTFTPLPELDSDEGREILRNWLAANAPVIERTQPRIDRLPVELGPCVPQCARTCVDVTWESIYAQIIRPTCALSQCHTRDDAQGGLDLLGEAAVTDPASHEGALSVRARLLEGGATTPACLDAGQNTMLVPGDPEASLFHEKVAATGDLCGARMPAAGSPLTEQQVCAIREWIACGACAEPDDALVDPADPSRGTCAECLDAARAGCGVSSPFDPAVGSAACVETPDCPNIVTSGACSAP